MISHWAYILVGNNNTGKTSFQRYLIEALCDQKYQKLRINTPHVISLPRAPRHFQTLFTANRSYQEKIELYGSVSGYFRNHFKEADVCILSSHSSGSCINDVKEMITELQRRAYNVAGVFWSNDFGSDAKRICELPWQERLWINNPTSSKPEKIQSQIRERAYRFADTLVEKSKHC